MTTTIIVAPCYDNYTIKKYLIEVLRYSGRHIIKLKTTSEGITVNGMQRTVRYHLTEGDSLCLSFTDSCNNTVLPTYGLLNVLYQDEDLFAVDKSHDVATHPDKAHYLNTLANYIMYYFHYDDVKNVHIATRLDKATSGVTLCARNSLVACQLTQMLVRHDITKTYIAVVDGELYGQGTINSNLARTEDSPITVVGDNGKQALTQYRCLQTSPSCTIVEMQPITGRTHQLRAHLASIGHPIVGDKLYGGSTYHRLMLHCYRLNFCHPTTNESITITSQLAFTYDAIDATSIVST